MSAESVVAFFGIRIELQKSDVEPLELRQHPLMLRARGASLQHYWGNFGGVDPKYLLLIGKKLAILGVENSSECIVSDAELRELTADVRRKLQAAGFDGEPALLLQVEPSP